MNTLDLDTRVGLLAQIIAEPDDDFYRRLYADWCEDHGELERAAFIRVQVELAKTKRTCPGPDLCRFKPCAYCALRRREQELHPQGSAEDVAFARLLMPDLRPGAQPPCRWEYHRGFVERITLPAADWLRHRDVLRVTTPLRKLVASDWDGETSPPWIGDDGERLVMAAGIGDFWGLTCRGGRLYDGRVEVVAAGRAVP